MILGTAGGIWIIFLFCRLLAFDKENIEIDVDVDFFVSHHLLKNVLVVGHRIRFWGDLPIILFYVSGIVIVTFT